ncbi:MAG: PAS domain S-box protein [Thermodesulfobacteriota bacterium]
MNMPAGSDPVFEEMDWRIRVFDSLSFPTLVLRPNRSIVCANRPFLEKYGTTLEELKGKTCHEFLYNSQEPWSVDTCPLFQVLADKKGHSTLKRILAPGGEEYYEDRVFSPILDDQGEVAYIIESLRDVTRLKTLEKELGVTKEFLEQVIESSPSAIMAADRSGKMLVINKAAEELFGYSTENGAKEYNVVDLYPPGLAKEIMRRLRDESIGGKGKLPNTKITIYNARGEEIPAEITAAILYEDDREVATMGIFNDLREKLAVEKRLREAQAQLIQSEKLASIGQLAAGVAHEINNPLTGILFYAHMVRDSLPEGDPRREDLAYIIEDVGRCKEIVKNLLAYSRQTSPAKNLYQLNNLVDQSLSLIRDQKLFGKIRVVKEMSDEMMMVHVDRNQLSQVIINLVMNAVAAMEGEGVLTFRTWRDKPAGRALLEVADTGYGIPEENLSKIFDPFFTTKELGKGTGLGLSTVYGIIQENGGRISVKKTGTEGTTFLVELPLYQPSENGEGL